MSGVIPICVAALVTGLLVWGCWVRVREQRERDAPERQRQRLRREYWGQL